MTTITLQDIKKHGSKAIDRTQEMYLIINSKPAGVIIPPDQYKMLIEAWEELEDLRDCELRKNEETVSFDEVFAELE